MTSKSINQSINQSSWSSISAMSPLPVKMMHKKEVVLNSVAEFLGIWAVRGEASLSLTTKDGVTTITFTHSLSGHPEDPLHPPPAAAGISPKRPWASQERAGSSTGCPSSGCPGWSSTSFHATGCTSCGPLNP